MTRQTLAPVHSTETAHISALAVLKSAAEGHGLNFADQALWQLTQFAGDEFSFDHLASSLPRCGLSASSHWLPSDALTTLPLIAKLPLILLAQNRSAGTTYYILVWQRIGPIWQVMDPVIGRRWLTTAQLQVILAPHRAEYSFEEMETLYNPELFVAELEKRMRSLLLPQALIMQGLSSLAGDWQDTAAIDAAVRFIQQLVKAGSLRPGEDAAGAFAKLFEKDPVELAGLIPQSYWTFKHGVEDLDGIKFNGLRAIEILGLDPSVNESEPTPAETPPRLPLDFKRFLGEPEKIIWEVPQRRWVAITI